MSKLASLCTLALAALWTGALACGAFEKPTPETAARDAYKAAVYACRVYDMAPGERHTPEMDRTCRSLRLVCDDAAGGAGGE